MLHSHLEVQLHKTKNAFKEAKSENIIELCKNYLLLLNAFRDELYKFRGKAEINHREPDSSFSEEILQKRHEMHEAITHTVQELNQTNALVNRLTSQNGYEAAETFNRLNFRGHKCWEFRGGKVGLDNSTVSEPIAVQEAVNIAIGLRCAEFISHDDSLSVNL
jgi:hypothetical protein